MSPFWIIAQSGLTGELPPEPFNVEIQHYSAELGPLALVIRCPHLTLSSLIQIHLHFLAPSERVEITSVTTTIMQAFTVYYVDSTKVAHPVPRLFVLPILSAMADANGALSPPASSRSLDLARPTSYDSTMISPTPTGLPQLLPTSGTLTPYSLARSRETYRSTPVTITLHPAQDAEAKFFVRVPTDEFARPSTLAETDSKIQVRHTLVVDTKYRIATFTGLAGAREWSEEKHVRLGKGVMITSCFCSRASRLLPSYEESGPVSHPPTNTLHTSSNVFASESTAPSSPYLSAKLPIRPYAACLCNTTLDEFHDREGAHSIQTGVLNGDGYDAGGTGPNERFSVNAHDIDEGQQRRREKSAAWASFSEMLA
ncbi:hypothetical protein P7C70_g637, partial [Phenoliferia sp. Uapishka_3]